jgi:hypothetical protein
MGKRRRSHIVRVIASACALNLGLARGASAEWTLAVFLGASRTGDSSLTVAQPADGTNVTLSPVHYDSASFEAPPYYGYRVGMFPGSGRFGIEGEFIHVKVIADTARETNANGLLRREPVAGARPLASVLERFSITHGVNLVLINAVVRGQREVLAGSDRPRWILAGRFGAGASIPHPESTVNGFSFEGYEWGAFSLQAAAAIEVRVAGPIYVGGEYKLTRTVQDVTIAGGSARTSLVTHHLVGGLVAHIGNRASQRYMSAGTPARCARQPEVVAGGSGAYRPESRTTTQCAPPK